MTDVIKDEKHLVKVLGSDRFLAMEGLNAEIPVYIYPYDATKQLEVDAATQRVVNKLASRGIPVLNIDLFELAISILKDRDVFEAVVEAEPDADRQYFVEDLRAMLDPRDDFAPAIRARLAASDAKVVILTGVGAVYPIIRSHVVLENVQDIARDVPVVLFFPGTYEQSSNVGSSLSLFGRIHDDRYYRARNILHQEA